MSMRSIVPFGPQHPVLPEPIHLDLVLEDEKVVEAVPSIGFVHRGLEQLVEKRDFQTYVYVAERICGICCGWDCWRMPLDSRVCSCKVGEFARRFWICSRNPQEGVLSFL